MCFACKIVLYTHALWTLCRIGLMTAFPVDFLVEKKCLNRKKVDGIDMSVIQSQHAVCIFKFKLRPVFECLYPPVRVIDKN